MHKIDAYAQIRAPAADDFRRKGAMIANAVLEDAGLITKNDTSYVIDKCTLDRDRK